MFFSNTCSNCKEYTLYFNAFSFKKWEKLKDTPYAFSVLKIAAKIDSVQ